VNTEEPVRTRGRITEWSRRSRAQLVARLSDLDYTHLYGRYRSCTDCGAGYSFELERCPTCRSTEHTLLDRSGRLPAMLTLTYPGDWVTVAPDGETVKRHLAALGKRYRRAWGEPLVAVWKLEFQRRGRPSLSPVHHPADGVDDGPRSAHRRMYLGRFPPLAVDRVGRHRRPPRSRGMATPSRRWDGGGLRRGHPVHRPAPHGGLLRQVRQWRGQGLPTPGPAGMAGGAVALRGLRHRVPRTGR
jgi:hypothetical protein